MDDVRDKVKDYYGKVLKCTSDLKTDTCCTVEGMKTKVHKDIRDAMAMVHVDVSSRFYGCGMVIPEELEGTRIVDLGSGSGQDCYVLSKLVGQSGHVTGVDMTEEQLEVAWKYIDYHTEKFSYTTPNIDFLRGYIERLNEAGVKENSYDIVISNCVVNLSPDKRAVIEEAYRALKVGGEVYFSDIYSDRRLSESIQQHEVLWGECVAGALWWQDLATIATEVGFSVPRLVSAKEMVFDREDFKKVLGDARFTSVTYRLFKLPSERKPACQVVYNGGIRWHEAELKFDYKHSFKAGEAVCVNSELATILQASRFNKYFDFQSDPATDIAAMDMIIDPFEYMAAMKPSVDAKVCVDAKAGCCATKAEPKTGCCATKAEPKTGCCAAKAEPKTGCCATKAEPKTGCCATKAEPKTGCCATKAEPKTGCCATKAEPKTGCCAPKT